MEMPQLWDQPNLIWIGIACLVVFFAASLLISGWSMKLACRICGADEIRFGYALLIAVASGVAGIAASLAVTFGVSEPSPLLAFLAPLLAMIAAIALLVRRNPFRAFGIYLLHSIISTVATLTVLVPLLTAAFFLVPPSLMEELSASTAGSIDHTSLMASMTAFGAGGESSDSLPVSQNEASQPVDLDASDLSELESALYRAPMETGQNGSMASHGSTVPHGAALAPAAKKPAPSPEKFTPRAVLPPGVERNPFVK